MSQAEDRWTPRARVEPGGPEAHARDELDDLLEGSSLGSPVVKRIQALVPAETARRARAHRPSLSARFDVNELVSRILAVMCWQAVAHRTGARLAGGNTTGDPQWSRADMFADAVPRPICPVDVWRSPGSIVLRMPSQMRAALRVIEQPGGPDRVLRQLVDDGVLGEVRDDVARRIALLAAALMDDAPPGLLRAYAVVLELKSTGERLPLAANDPGREGRRGGNQPEKSPTRLTFPSERPRPAWRYFETHDRYVGDPTPSSFMPITRPRRFSDLFRFALYRHGEPDPACSPDTATGSDIFHVGFLNGFSHDAGKSYRSFQRAILCRKRHEAWTRCPECQREWAAGWPSSTINMRAAQHMLTSCAPADRGKALEMTPHRLLHMLGYRSESAWPHRLIDLSPHVFCGLSVRTDGRELLDRVLPQRVLKRGEAAVTEAAGVSASSGSTPTHLGGTTAPENIKCSRCYET